MQIIKVSGTEGKRALSEFLQEGITGSWLLALEGSEEADDAFMEEGETASTAILDTSQLSADGLIPQDSVVIVEANAVFKGLEPALAVFLTDSPLDELEPDVRAAGNDAGLVLVELGSKFSAVDELWLEKDMKGDTGAGKVLIYSDDEGRMRAFRKALDLARSHLGGVGMPEEIPEKVIEAVREAALENKIDCERAHGLASELDVEIALVGRALDLLNIKITKCQLGCF